MMKKLLLSLMAVAAPLLAVADGWPADYGGVMLQAFYWDSFADSKWTKLESQADELAQYFDLVWVPQSGNCAGTSMGYDDLYWFNNYNSSFGNEAALRSMIKTFKSKGIGTIADVVINHRKTINDWVTFPTETYKGVTYQMLSTDITKNDDGGSTLAWANENGKQLSQYNDTGEDWGGMRDLDHRSANVQTIVKAYLDFLLNDLGYTGFRYDMVKGYLGSFTGQYNAAAKPQFSVGENWSGTGTIVNWIKSTAYNGVIQSGAFDFQFRYVVRNACNSGNWLRLGKNNDDYNEKANWPIISNNYDLATYLDNGAYRRYAVTFVENHDTERRAGAEQDPLKKDTLAANAYMMALPGTPCVFMKHWKDCKQAIKGMIDVRKAVGITNTSEYINAAATARYYSDMTYGKNGNLLTVVGNVGELPVSETLWTPVVEGYHYKYYMNNSMNIAWADKASGEYPNPFNVKVAAVSAAADKQVVYTTDGSTPSASNGTRVASGTEIYIDKNLTLKVGLLSGGTVKGIQTRNYTLTSTEPFVPFDITIYVKDPGWQDLNFWAWREGIGNLCTTNTNWPGDAILKNGVLQSAGKSTIIKGEKFYYKSYTATSNDFDVSFIFSSTGGSPQTVDLGPFTKDTYLELDGTETGGKLNARDVTSTYGSDGVDDIVATRNADNGPVNIYTIDGRLVRTNTTTTDGLPRGIYIVGHRKVVIR